MTMKTLKGVRYVNFLVLVAVAAGLFTACPPYPPPPPGARVTIHAEGPAIPLPPPPPILLPPAPVVTFSASVGCDYVYGANYDAFYVDGYFYTYHDHHWFCTPRPGVAWVIVPSGHVPPIFRHGPPPPGWDRALAGPRRTVSSFRAEHPFPVPPEAKAAARSRPGEAPATRAATPSSRGRVEQPAPSAATQPRGRGRTEPSAKAERPTSSSRRGQPTSPDSGVAPEQKAPTPKPAQPSGSGASDRPKPGRSSSPRSGKK